MEGLCLERETEIFNTDVLACVPRPIRQWLNDGSLFDSLEDIKFSVTTFLPNLNYDVTVCEADTLLPFPAENRVIQRNPTSSPAQRDCSCTCAVNIWGCSQLSGINPL